MIRIVLFLIIVGALSLGAAWLADRPGDVVIIWQGLRIKTSVMVLGFAVVVALAVLLAIWSLIRLVLRSPGLLSRHRQHRRGVRAYEAISNGLIAVGAGDIAAAQKHAAAVNRLTPAEPLALLLNAQSAQLSGDREGAERTFRAMASRADTKPLGLHGLFVEAHRRNDPVSARAYAEEAARTAPSLGWASRAVLEARCKDGDWAGALSLLEANARTLAKDIYHRQRAVLLTAHARALEDTDRDRAKALALEAQKLAPTFVPAASLAARLLAEGGQQRKASRIIDKAWRANPHPELAQTYSELRSGESARDKLKRIEGLAAKAPGHIEGALATARAALDAQEFAKARAALEPYLAAPTRRIALLMAELERVERNDVGRAREWLARAVHAPPDPAWTADGHVSEHWLPASPVTGRLDALEWRVPVTGMASLAVIEPAPAPAPAAPVEITSEAPPKGDGPPSNTGQPATVADGLSSQRTDEVSQQKTESRLEPKPEPIIPLILVPDDPGPDAVEESEPHTEHESGWRKIFG
jgi:HemY protein